MSQVNLAVFKNHLSELSKLINLDKKEILNLQNKKDYSLKIGISLLGLSSVIIIAAFITPISLFFTLPVSGIILLDRIDNYKSVRKKIFEDASLFRVVKGEEENGEINVLKKKIQSKLQNEDYLLKFLESHYKKDLIKLLNILEINNYPLIYYKILENAVDNLYNIDYSSNEFIKYAKMLDVDLNKAKSFKDKVQKELNFENGLPNLDKEENIIDSIKVEETTKEIPIEDKKDLKETKKLKF